MNPPLIRCSDVARTFGTGPSAVVAVHGARCEIHQGDRIAVTGPSGSGKSTFLHLLAGLDVPTTGRVSWPLLGARADLRPGRIGMVFQAPSLLPPLDVTENVALPLLLLGVDRATANRRAAAVLELLDLSELANQLPEELSGGQAQRVAVARAIAPRPAVILADEPTGQLDHVTGAHMIDVLLDAADQTAAAVVVATHDAQVAGRLRERWGMHDGRLRVPERAAW